MPRDIENLTLELADKYPYKDAYWSRSSMYAAALNDKVISQSEYDEARKFYGKLWFYVGD